MKYILTTVTLLIAYAISAQDVTSGLIYKEEVYQKEIQSVTQLLSNQVQLDSFVTQAYLNSPVVKSYDEDMKLYDEEYLQKKRNWVSSFRFGVNLFSATTAVNQTDQTSTTTYGVLPNLGLSFALDPTQLVNRNSLMRQAEGKKMRSYYQLQDQKQTLKVELVNLLYEYLSMLEAVLIRQHALEDRKQYLNVFEIDFKNGNRSIDELLIVQHQVHLAEEGLLSAHVQAMKTKSKIDILIGNR